jgi:uncharacterized protein (DUF1499 family)
MTKTVSLINFSKKAIKISLDCDDQIQNLQKFFISVNPLTEIVIPAREKHDIELRFKPQTRLHEFSQDLKFKLVENQEVRKLLTISGQVHGVELKLLE